MQHRAVNRMDLELDEGDADPGAGSGEGLARVAPEMPPEDGLPAVMTVDEVARLLRVNPKTVYEAVDRGEIPGVRRVGRVIRMSRDVVLRWLTEGQGRVSRSSRRSK